MTRSTPRRRLAQLGDPPEPAGAGLPLAWFAATVVWMTMGAIGLVRTSPLLAQGVYPTPAVLGTVHAFTLGVLASAVFGALHQFVPAVLGVPIRRPGVAWWGFWLMQAGTVLLIGGFERGSPPLQGAAWLFLLAGVGCASLNTVPARRQATQNQRVGLYITLGHSALGLGMLLALVRIGDGLGWWQTSRPALLALHLHFGVAGFGTLTAMGMTSKMLPAFLGISHPADRPLDWLGWCLATGLLLLTVGVLASIAPATWLGALFLAYAAITHLAVLVGYVRRRTTAIEPGIAHILGSLVAYAGTVATGLALLILDPHSPILWIAYTVLGLVGWLLGLILGVLHRVVPRILTPMLVRRGALRSASERRGEWLSPGLGWISVGCWNLGWIVLTAGVIGGAATIASMGAISVSIAALAVLGQALRVVGYWRRRPTHEARVDPPQVGPL